MIIGNESTLQGGPFDGTEMCGTLDGTETYVLIFTAFHKALSDSSAARLSKSKNSSRNPLYYRLSKVKMKLGESNFKNYLSCMSSQSQNDAVRSATFLRTFTLQISHFPDSIDF